MNFLHKHVTLFIFSKEDILVFADYFLQQTNKEFAKSISGFDEEVKNKLFKYSWYGF